jgi:hypothetical protein
MYVHFQTPVLQQLRPCITHGWRLLQQSRGIVPQEEFPRLLLPEHRQMSSSKMQIDVRATEAAAAAAAYAMMA